MSLNNEAIKWPFFFKKQKKLLNSLYTSTRKKRLQIIKLAEIQKRESSTILRNSRFHWFPQQSFEPVLFAIP